MVLPCKDWLEVVFGDQVLFWGIDKDCAEQPIREISLDDADRIGWYDGYKTVFLKGTDENGEAWEFYPEEIGKTIFLTREAAEAALEGMKMAEYIERSAAIEAAKHAWAKGLEPSQYIEALPAADVAPIEALERLRDELCEQDLITMEGLRRLNTLIWKYTTVHDGGQCE